MKTGDVVKFSSPQEGEEDLRFVVLESFEYAQPPRVTVRLIDGSYSIPPVSTYAPQEFTLA